MICYRKPEFNELEKIARVHMKCFQDYFLTSFGVELVQKYYEEFFKEKELFVVAEDENNEIVGFVMGYLQGSVARATFESKYKKELAIKLILRCLKLDRLAISKCVGKVKSILKKNKKHGNEQKETVTGDLLSICVLPHWRGQGIAEELTKNFEKLLADNGVSAYILSVLKDNVRARKFYEKLGFEKFSENNTEVKYIKDLK